jgi:hypothetical protein
MKELKFVLMIGGFALSGLWVGLASNQPLYGHAVFMFGIGISGAIAVNRS